MKQTENAQIPLRRCYQEAVAMKGGGIIGNYRVVNALISEVIRPSPVEMAVAGYILYQLGVASTR